MLSREGIKDRAVDLLTRTPLVYSVLASEPVHGLLKARVSRFVGSLRDPQDPDVLNPSNETLLGKLIKLEKLSQLVLPDKSGRFVESKIADALHKDLEGAVESGKDTNLTLKLKRTLGLMGERYLNSVLLDFMVVNFGLGKLKERFLTKQGIPSFHCLVLQINSECNAKPRCPGCFAANDKDKLSFETLDRVQSESISLASRFSVIVGGEPLLERENLLRLLRKYHRTPFLVATNGILLDDAYASEVADLGNVFTFINIPGLESTTNEIRENPKAWNYIKKAAENLRKYHAAAGFVSTVSQTNFIDVSSPEFVQQMIDLGMMLGFYFTHTDPIGCSSKEGLALTSGMTEEFSQRTKDVSGKYPLCLVNTAGGEGILGGCPAGRVDLIYVQSNGKVGSCPAVPQLGGGLNVNNLPLREILMAPYFERIRREQPSCVRSPEFWANSQS